MKKIKTVTGFRRFKDLELAEMSQVIINKMTDNTYYQTPTPTLQVLQEATRNYSDSLARCKVGSKEDTSIKNEKRYILEKYLAILGNYVNSIADGNMVKLDSSGFPLSKTPQKVGVLNAPEFIKVSAGDNPGEVYFEISRVQRAKVYIVFYAPVPAPEKNIEWYEKVSSSPKGWISGLESGKRYSFKATAASSESNSLDLYNFTAPVERFIH